MLMPIVFTTLTVTIDCLSGSCIYANLRVHALRKLHLNMQSHAFQDTMINVRCNKANEGQCSDDSQVAFTHCLVCVQA